MIEIEIIIMIGIVFVDVITGDCVSGHNMLSIRITNMWIFFGLVSQINIFH